MACSRKCTCLRSVRPVEAHATGGHGEFTNAKYAKLGDLGSNMPKMPSGAVWKRGSTVETRWSIRANHGYQCTNIDSARRTPIWGRSASNRHRCRLQEIRAWCWVTARWSSSSRPLCVWGTLPAGSTCPRSFRPRRLCARVPLGLWKFYPGVTVLR